MSLDLQAIQSLIHTVNQNKEAMETENRWREALGHSVNNDRSKILDGVNPDDVLEAVKCLDMLINTHDDVRKALGVKGIPGRKKGDKLNEEKTPDAFLIVAALDAGVIGYSEAVNGILALEGSSLKDDDKNRLIDVDESTVKKFIKKVRQSLA
jgi:hypothetical protein